MEEENSERDAPRIPDYILFYLISFTRVRYTTRDLHPEYLGMQRDKFVVYLKSLCGMILSESQLWDELNSFSVIALNRETHNWMVVEPEFSAKLAQDRSFSTAMMQAFKVASENKKIEQANTPKQRESDPKSTSNFEATTNLQRGRLASLRSVIKNVKRDFYKRF